MKIILMMVLKLAGDIDDDDGEDGDDEDDDDDDTDRVLGLSGVKILRSKAIRIFKVLEYRGNIVPEHQAIWLLGSQVLTSQCHSVLTSQDLRV